MIAEKLYDVIFIVESSVINGEYFEELKKSYIFPIITFFNGGFQPMETDWLGAETAATQFCLLTFVNKSRLGSNVTRRKATRNAFEFKSQLNEIKLNAGGLTDCSLLGEGLAVALQTFDDQTKARDSSSNVVRHCIVIANAPPYNLPVFGNTSYSGTTFDALLDLFVKKSVHLSLICSRCVPQFKDLIMKTGQSEGSDIIAQSSQYAVHPNHMVFLRGIQLPVQEASNLEQTVKSEQNTFNSVRKNPETDPTSFPIKKVKLEETFPSMLQQSQTQLSSNNMVLSTFPQSSQNNIPTNPMSSQGPMATEVLVNIAKMNSIRPTMPHSIPQSQPMLLPTPQMSRSIGQQMQIQQQGLVRQPQPQQMPPQQQSDRKLAWIGRLQWQETTVTGNETGKSVTRLLECKATIHKNEELKTDVWPPVLKMQLIPQTYLQTLSEFLKHAKIVIFHFTSSDSETLQAMYRVMNGAGPAGNPAGGTGQKFAGCVILTPPNPPDPNHVRVLLLIYSPKKKAFIGIIPEQQQHFVNRLGAIINQDKNLMTNMNKPNDMGMMTRPVRPPVMNPHIPTSNQPIANQMDTTQILARQQQLPQNPLRNILSGMQPQSNNMMTAHTKQQLLMQQQQQQQVSLPQQTQIVNSQLPWSNQQQHQPQQQQQQQQQLRQQLLFQQQRQARLAQQQQQKQQQQLSDPIYSDFLGNG